MWSTIWLWGAPAWGFGMVSDFSRGPMDPLPGQQEVYVVKESLVQLMYRVYFLGGAFFVEHDQEIDWYCWSCQHLKPPSWPKSCTPKVWDGGTVGDLHAAGHMVWRGDGLQISTTCANKLGDAGRCWEFGHRFGVRMNPAVDVRDPKLVKMFSFYCNYP